MWKKYFSPKKTILIDIIFHKFFYFSPKYFSEGIQTNKLEKSKLKSSQGSTSMSNILVNIF